MIPPIDPNQPIPDGPSAGGSNAAAAAPPSTPTPVYPDSWRGYFRISRTATYGFLSALPLLVLYEVMILLSNRGALTQVRVGAEVWMKRVLASVGGTSLFALGLVVLAIGVFIFIRERRHKIPLRPRYLVWMIGESALYAIVVAGFVSAAVGLLFAMAPVALPALVALAPQAAEGPGLFTMLSLSIGAGLYEELLFRVLLVGGLYWVFKRLFTRPLYAYLSAALLGAFVFSAVHYIGALGDVFTLSSFTFRFLFGLVLNALFLARGFGVAAWTHALYDVMVVTNLLG